MASLLFLTMLVTLFFGTAIALERTPDRVFYKRSLISAAVVITFILTFIFYPSDPRGWSLDRFILYLAEPQLEVMAILGNLITGSVMFGLFALGIYWANRSR